jgi:hypothetical protein
MYSYIPLHATAFTPQRARSKKEGEDRRKTREKAQRRIIEKTEEKLTSWLLEGDDLLDKAMRGKYLVQHIHGDRIERVVYGN